MSDSGTRRRLGLAFGVLALSHMVIDAYSSGYAPLLAALRDRLGLSLTQVGGCTAILAFSSSILQPAYGLLSDRLRTRLVVAAAPAATAVGIGALGLVDSYSSALFLFFLIGVGLAAFHPQGAAQARETAPAGPGLSMSLFFGSGNLGFAAGPLAAGAVLSAWGWPGLWRLALPGLLASIVLLWLAPNPEPARPRTEGGNLLAALRRRWRPLLLLYLLVVVRGGVQLVYVGFLPLYFMELGADLTGASRALSLFLACGAVGGLTGGVLNDRFGGRWVIRVSMGGALPFLVAAFFLPAGWQVASLAAGYFFLLLTMPVNLVMAQDWVPEHRSTVSSLMMGFAWGVGGVSAPLVGRLADAYGLRLALLGVAMLPAIGILLAWRMPAPAVDRSEGAAAAAAETAAGEAASS